MSLEDVRCSDISANLKVEISHPRTVLGIAHKPYYGISDIQVIKDALLGGNGCYHGTLGAFISC